MMVTRVAEDAGCARWTFRLRVSSAARTALMGEWGRCRWIWNECVAKSQQIHQWNNKRPEGADLRSGAARQHADRGARGERVAA